MQPTIKRTITKEKTKTFSCNNRPPTYIEIITEKTEVEVSTDVQNNARLVPPRTMGPGAFHDPGHGNHIARREPLLVRQEFISCGTSQKSITYRSSLKRHERYHCRKSDKKECPVREQSFSRPDALPCHIRAMHQENH